MNRWIGPAVALLFATATSLEAEAPTRARARCNPDWTREGQPKSKSSRRADDMDLTYPLKKARVLATPEELLTLLRSPSSIELRSAALIALSDCEFRETRAELEAFMEDPDSEPFRKLLVSILLDWGSAKAGNYVRNIAEDPSSRDGVRLLWYPMYIDYGGDCDTAFLLRMVKSEETISRQVSAQTVAALLARPDYRYTGRALMRELLRDSDKGVRSSATRYLDLEISRLDASRRREKDENSRKEASEQIQQLLALSKSAQAVPELVMLPASRREAR